MKTIHSLALYVALSTCLYMVSCNESKKPDLSETKTVEQDPDYLRASLKDSMHQAFEETLLEINRDLVAIADKSGKKTLGPGSAEESDISAHERILRNISLIHKMVDDNKKKIASLTGQVNKYTLENNSLYALLDQDSQVLASYEDQMDSLNSELAYQQYTIEELKEKLDYLQVHNDLLQIEAEHYQEDMSTAYYVCQDRKTLKDRGIVEDKGGVLGLGKTTSIGQNIKNGDFTKIDTRKVTSIPIRGEKPELVSNHPKGSYEFKKENNMTTYLHINNPDRFWNNTKYMVVAVR